MSSNAAEKFLSEVPGWVLIENASKLKRTFKVDDFADAMQLAQHVGELCDAEGHHPDLAVGWGYCTVKFQTHKINGLHENDFIMASKVSQLADGNIKIK